MNVTTIGRNVIGYGKRIANVYPEMVLGTGTEIVGQTLKSTKGSVWTKAKAGFKALEKDVAAKQAVEGGFFKRLGKNLVSTPSTIKNAAVDGYKAAKLAGKSGIWGGTKGFLSGIGKKLPFIGAALMVVTELPNLWTATKEQGIGQGVKEVAKSGARLGGGAIGAAIGAATIPLVGGLIGWVAGEWLTSKIVGQSYSEQKAEAIEKLAQAQQAPQMQQPSFTGNPDMNTGMYNNPMNGYNDYSNPYADDIMMQNLNFMA